MPMSCSASALLHLCSSTQQTWFAHSCKLHEMSTLHNLNRKTRTSVHSLMRHLRIRHDRLSCLKYLPVRVHCSTSRCANIYQQASDRAANACGADSTNHFTTLKRFCKGALACVRVYGWLATAGGWMDGWRADGGRMEGKEGGMKGQSDEGMKGWIGGSVDDRCAQRFEKHPA